MARAMAGLSQDQEARREQHPDAAQQIDLFVAKLRSLRLLDRPWTLELEDISGMSTFPFRHVRKGLALSSVAQSTNGTPFRRAYSLPH